MTEETLKKANDLHREIRILERNYKDIDFDSLNIGFVNVKILGVSINLPDNERCRIAKMAKENIEKQLTNLKQQLAEL